MLTYKKKQTILDLIKGTTNYEQKRTIISEQTVANINYSKPYLENVLTMIINKNLDYPKEYQHITIPKRKGGVRHIVNPSDELKDLQRKYVNLLKEQLRLLPHNCAHAYTNHRDSLTNAEQHKNAKMILSLDIHDFFGSITKECLIKNLSKITTYKEANEKVDNKLNEALKVCLLDNVLPQGSPASPYLSNLIMMEFDERIDRFAKSKNLVYTRYADDMYFSGEIIEHPKQIELLVQDYLKRYVADTIQLNKTKTKITRPGQCYITGIKLNQNNELTYGHKQKSTLKHAIYNLFIKANNGKLTKEETQEVLGLFSYAHRIEPAYFDYIERKYLTQFHSTKQTLVQHFKQFL